MGQAARRPLPIELHPNWAAPGPINWSHKIAPNWALLPNCDKGAARGSWARYYAEYWLLDIESQNKLIFIFRFFKMMLMKVASICIACWRSKGQSGCLSVQGIGRFILYRRLPIKERDGVVLNMSYVAMMMCLHSCVLLCCSLSLH